MKLLFLFSLVLSPNKCDIVSLEKLYRRKTQHTSHMERQKPINLMYLHDKRWNWGDNLHKWEIGRIFKTQASVHRQQFSFEFFVTLRDGRYSLTERYGDSMREEEWQRARNGELSNKIQDDLTELGQSHWICTVHTRFIETGFCETTQAHRAHQPNGLVYCHS